MIYPILAAAIWGGLGLFVWIACIRALRKITVEDLIVLPFCVSLGGISLILWAMANARSSDLTLWRW